MENRVPDPQTHEPTTAVGPTPGVSGLGVASPVGPTDGELVEQAEWPGAGVLAGSTALVRRRRR